MTETSSNHNLHHSENNGFIAEDISIEDTSSLESEESSLLAIETEVNLSSQPQRWYQQEP